jgi:hypothetical protein
VTDEHYSSRIVLLFWSIERESKKKKASATSVSDELSPSCRIWFGAPSESKHADCVFCALILMWGSWRVRSGVIVDHHSVVSCPVIEVILARSCERNQWAALLDRTIVLDNLELVLLIDEHWDGGIILDTTGSKLEPLSCFAMKNTPPLMMVKGQGTAVYVGPSGKAGVPGLGPGVSSDVTLEQAFRKIGGQMIAAEASNKRAYNI